MPTRREQERTSNTLRDGAAGAASAQVHPMDSARSDELFQSLPLPLYIFDKKDLTLLAINPAAIKCFGYSRSQVSKMNMLDMRPHEDWGMILRSLSICDGHHSAQRPWLNIKGDGEQILVELYSRPIEYRGRAAVLVVAVDVSNRRFVVDELERTQSLLQAVVENMPSIVFVKDATEHRFVMLNRAGEELLGISQNEIVGKNDYDLFPSDQADAFRERDQAVIDRCGAPILHEEPIQTPNGGLRLLRTRKVALMSPRGRPTFLVGVSEDITHARSVEKSIEELSLYDRLTGLYNRHVFVERLAQALDGSAPVLVIAIKLSGLRAINKTFGHDFGNKLLAEVGRSIRATASAQATLGRLSGDRFGYFQRVTNDIVEARKIADAAISALKAALIVEGRRGTVSAFFGIAFSPADGVEVGEILSNAEFALDRAKTVGGRCFQISDESMREQFATRSLLASELPSAVRDGELEMFYQPQFRLSDRVLVGAEALLRWNHPRLGLLGPAAFLEVLDASELAEEVGRWTILAACRAMRRWRDRSLPPIRMGVNLFAAHLGSGHLLDDVKAILAECGLPANALELEITERIALSFDNEFIVPMRALRALGVGIAFDDFGTGFASLSALKAFPLTRLKIDRSFLTNIATPGHDAAIVEAILTMARRLDLSVIAEGVETKEQFRTLESMGCEEGQGYFFGKPMTDAALSDLLAAQRAEGARWRA